MGRKIGLPRRHGLTLNWLIVFNIEQIYSVRFGIDNNLLWHSMLLQVNFSFVMIVLCIFGYLPRAWRYYMLMVAN